MQREMAALSCSLSRVDANIAGAAMVRCSNHIRLLGGRVALSSLEEEAEAEEDEEEDEEAAMLRKSESRRRMLAAMDGE